MEGNTNFYTVFSQLEKGNVLLISEFSRLGKSMLEIMEIILFAIDKEINMYKFRGNWQLDDTIQSQSASKSLGQFFKYVN